MSLGELSGKHLKPNSKLYPGSCSFYYFKLYTYCKPDLQKWNWPISNAKGIAKIIMMPLPTFMIENTQQRRLRLCLHFLIRLKGNVENCIKYIVY